MFWNLIYIGFKLIPSPYDRIGRRDLSQCVQSSGITIEMKVVGFSEEFRINGYFYLEDTELN